MIYEEPELSYSKRQALMNAYLGNTLGLDASGSGPAKLVGRRDIGEVVHIFSHIRQTMHVELLTLRADNLGKLLNPAAALPAVPSSSATAAAAAKGGGKRAREETVVSDDDGDEDIEMAEASPAAAAADSQAKQSTPKARDFVAFDALNDSDDDGLLIARSPTKPKSAAATAAAAAAQAKQPPSSAGAAAGSSTKAGASKADAANGNKVQKDKAAGKAPGKAAKAAAAASAVAAAPSTKWIVAGDLNGQSVSTGVKKVFKLVSSAPSAAAPKQPSLSKFFKKA